VIKSAATPTGAYRRPCNWHSNVRLDHGACSLIERNQRDFPFTVALVQLYRE